MKDPFITDPALNKDFPASQLSKVIKSGDAEIYIIVEIAEGKGPHPTVIFFYGYPGDEKNSDIAQLLRRAGYNCVIFFYRGSWGSKGFYSIKNCIEDGVNVTNYLKTNAELFRVKISQIIYLGFSMGGFYAILSSLQTKINKIITLNNINISFFIFL